MSIIEALIYGVIQGVAEFLPVSSSGHLTLTQSLLGLKEQNNIGFVVLLHFATLVSVVVVYHKEVWLIIKGFFSLMGKLFKGKLFAKGAFGKDNLIYGERLFLMLFVATLPLIPASLLSGKIEALSKINWVIGGFLIINGIVLFVSDKLENKGQILEDSDLKKPFYVGLFQLFGLLPGISRSGSTITSGIFFGFERREAVKLSFLMSIPAVLGAGVLEFPKFLKEGLSTDLAVPYLVATLTAAIVGFFAIKVLQYIAKKANFSIFGIYCIIIGITAVAVDVLS